MVPTSKLYLRVYIESQTAKKCDFMDNLKWRLVNFASILVISEL